jgi:hypothetical protein
MLCPSSLARTHTQEKDDEIKKLKEKLDLMTTSSLQLLKKYKDLKSTCTKGGGNSDSSALSNLSQLELTGITLDSSSG